MDTKNFLDPRITDSQIYDVMIVGAGPGGSIAAYYLGKDPRKNILIVDAHDFPRQKCCAGGLFFVEDWPLEFENFRLIQNELPAFSCYDFHFYCNEAYFYHTPDIHIFDVVDRFDFDHALVKIALQSPQVRFETCRIREIDRLIKDKESIYRLRGREKTYYARKIIGADGFGSVVSRFLGNRPARRTDYGRCIQYDLKCAHVGQGSTSVFLNWQNELGFSWIFPNPDGYALGMGLIGETRQPLHQMLDEFLQYALTQNLIPAEFEKKRLSGACCPVAVARQFGHEDILLCGDALGAVRQLTGEGIYYAMKTGQIAAQCLLEDAPNLAERYRRSLKPILKQITLIRGFHPGPICKFLLRVCIRIFSIRLPFGWHQKVRKKIIDKFHRMDTLSSVSKYKQVHG